MRLRIVAGAALILATTGCDRFKTSEAKPEPVKTEKAAAPAKKNVNQPVEDAMAQIPPEMRVTYQAAFACDVKANNAKKGKAIQITPAYVRELMGRLKANPGIAKC